MSSCTYYSKVINFFIGKGKVMVTGFVAHLENMENQEI